MHWGISRKVYCQLEDQCKACCFFGCYFCCLLEVSWLAAAVVAVEARDPGSVVGEPTTTQTEKSTKPFLIFNLIFHVAHFCSLFLNFWFLLNFLSWWPVLLEFWVGHSLKKHNLRLSYSVDLLELTD